MMRKTLPLLLAPALTVLLLAGCNSSLTSTTGTGSSGSNTVPVAVSMTDDPPAGVSVLFFQVSLTDATLTPATGSPVSLLSNGTPIQVDVTQLQALSAFLSTANAAAGTYNSLSLTFANPQLVIYNESDTSLGSSCTIGSICQLTPAFDDDSATQTFSTAPFPLTLSSGSPLGLVIDFHLDTVIQSDLSVNLSATNGVTVSELPPPPAPRQFGSLTGTVGTVTAASDQFTVQTQWGRTFTIDTTTSTTFNDFPSSACTTAGIACLAQGQVVQVQVSGFSSGALTASQVTYVQQAAAQTVEGTIVSIPPLPLPVGETLLKVILHQSPTANSALPLGGVASVAVWGPGSGSNTPTTFSIDSNGFTIPSGYIFTAASGLTVGQNVQITITPGSITTTGSGPSPDVWGPPPSLNFTASAIALEPSQLTGSITAIDSATTSFTLGFGGPFFAPWPMASPNAVSFDVVTTGQTTYTGFSTDTFDGLATGDFASVNGWLFPPATTGPPTIIAQSVLMRPSPVF